MRNNIKVLHISETGYIFQSRERLEREIAGNMPSQLDDFLGKLNGILDTTKKLSDKQLKDTEARNKREEAKKLDELMNVPSIKSAYKDLEITNKKLIETADKLSNLDTFLNNTMELTNLKKEYNTIARECLIQLTKFRISVQTWASEHPEYARVAELILNGAEKGAIVVAGIGVVTAFLATAEISIPVAIVGTGIAVGASISIDYIIEHYIREPLKKYVKKQGIGLREKIEFEDTVNWLVDGIKYGKNAKPLLHSRNYTKIFKPRYSKTYIPKVDKSIELAGIMRNATKVYTQSQRARLIEDVLRIITNG